MRTTTFDEIDGLFDRMNRYVGDGQWADHTSGWGHGGMRVDLSEHDDDLTVVADLPGFEREEIDLSVEDDRLVVVASHGEAVDDEEQYLRRERQSNTIRRTISLPVAVDAEAAHASYTNGVLTVTLPKLVESEGHRIHID